MFSTLIVARMSPESGADVARVFGDFDDTDMPHLMGTRRRELFHFKGLYFHLQDFDDTAHHEVIEEVKAHPSFVQISADLKPFIEAYDPLTWRSPKDAMATRFYHWSAAA